MRPISTRCFIAFSLLFVLAVALRLTDIGKEAMWHDEVASVRMTASTVAYTMSTTAKDSTPFGYFIGLHSWRKAVPPGDGWMRAYNAFWSMIGVALLAGFAAWLLGVKHALIVLLFVAVNPLNIYYAQELRMYSQANAFGILSSWLLLIWADASTRRRVVTAGVGYAFAAAALLLTHYVCLMLLLAQGTFVLLYFIRSRNWKRIAGYAGMTALTVLLFLPWYLYVVHVNGGISAKNASWISLPPMHYYVSYVAQEFFWGRTWTIYSRWWPLSLSVVLLVVSLSISRCFRLLSPRRRPFQDMAILAFFTWMIFGPVVYVAIISRVFQPIFDRQRFALFLLPPFLLLLAFGCMASKRLLIRSVLTGTIAIMMLIGTIFQFRLVHKPDFRAVGRLFGEKGPPDRPAALPTLYRLPMGHVLGKKPPYLTLHESADTRLLPQGTNVWILSSYASDLHADKLKNHLETLGTTETLLIAHDIIVTSVTVQRAQ